jgi:hypothetical protein
MYAYKMINDFVQLVHSECHKCRSSSLTPAAVPSSCTFTACLRPNKYIGNIRLNELVTHCKEEYVSTKSYSKKAIVTWEINEEIALREGQF